ncbi:MAG TPA: hypothetical protein VIL22_07805 [Paenibacillaceae bacterium]
MATDLSFRRFRELDGDAELRAFREEMERAGYSAFFAFVSDFREAIKSYADEEAEAMTALIRRARELFPAPERFSPAWERVWTELEGICAAKNEALAAIPPSARNGEWQVLIDNPYVSQPVVCYPGLSFLDAVYLFGYFRQDLAPNERLRLQRVTDVVESAGNRPPAAAQAKPPGR